MKKSKSTKRRERGIAVLFALGIMAIILVIVTLYSDMAISERKVASSYDNSQTAKLLAAALVDRIKMTISYAQSNVTSFDVNTFVSRNTDDGSQDCDFIYKIENGSDVDLGSSYNYTSKGCPVWKYVKSNDGHIVARYAYAGYLGSSEKLNPNDVAGTQIKTYTIDDNGTAKTANLTATNHSGDDAVSLNTISDPNGKYQYYKNLSTAAWQIVTPANRAYNRRLGATLAELDIDPTAGVTSALLRSHTGTSWGDAASLLTGLGLTASDANIQKVDADFSFSSKTYDEAYYAGDLDGNGARDREEYFHRFNLCVSQDKWNEWAKTAVDKAPNETSSNEKDVWVFLKEPISIASQDNPADGSYGIPFFRNWTDPCGMASAHAARNQVMANILNAFADDSNNAYLGYPNDSNGRHTEYFPFWHGDSIPPISDVPASQWKTCTIHPTYTGNKRTMYLNELFVAVKLVGSYTAGTFDKERSIYTGRTYTVRAQLYTGAEVVRMWPYDNSDYSMIKPCAMTEYPYITGYFTADFSYGDGDGVAWQQKNSDNPFCKVEDWCNWNESAYPYGGKPYGNQHNGCVYNGTANGSVNANQVYRIFQRGGISTADTVKENETVFSRTPEAVTKANAEKKRGLMLVRNMTFHPKKFILTNYKAYNTDSMKAENSKRSGGIAADYPNDSSDGVDGHEDRGMNVDYAILPEVNISDGIDVTPPAAGKNRTVWVYFSIQANDPRQNLNPGDWTIVKGKLDASGNELLPEIKEDIMNGSLVETGRDVGLANNFFTAGRNTTIIQTSPCDEENNNPAYGSATQCQSSGCMPYKTTFSYVPEAFYPCTTLWQLGSIHRAKAWQTINLKKAMYYDRDMDIREAPSGTYTDGDALLLDQVKITPNVKMAKMNLYANDPDEAKKRYHSLFNNFPRLTNGQQGVWAPFQTNNTPWQPTIGTSAVNFPSVPVDTGSETIYDYLYSLISSRLSDNGSTKKFERRTDILSDDKFCTSIMGGGTNDAQQEEAIGRLLNLTEYMPPVDPSVSIVVQTINDVEGTALLPGGDEAWDVSSYISDENIKQAKWNKKIAGYARPDGTIFGTTPALPTAGTVITAQKGRYDLYADKITGEAKINVVVHYDMLTNKWKIKSYEYTE